MVFTPRHAFLISMDASAAKPIALEFSNQLIATTAINKALSNADKAIVENQDELSKAQIAYIKTREENQRINAILDDIKQQSMELENTFQQIDQLEMFVNHVKDTFNQVADCVGSMEKSVLANSGLSVGSIPMSFKFVSVFEIRASG
ncbi:hypothetical protein BC943DRAFT_32304 [Umbelopsis sp. AD052]|nr:hypothetical protein BC943DRAFT_32304 [Umbelopsis sp. AD052]